MTFIDIPNKTISKFFVTVNLPKQFSMKPLFTSNVFYKPNTSSFVSNTVRNYNSVKRRT